MRTIVDSLHDLESEIANGLITLYRHHFRTAQWDGMGNRAPRELTPDAKRLQQVLGEKFEWFCHLVDYLHPREPDDWRLPYRREVAALINGTPEDETYVMATSCSLLHSMVSDVSSGREVKTHNRIIVADSSALVSLSLEGLVAPSGSERDHVLALSDTVLEDIAGLDRTWPNVAAILDVAVALESSSIIDLSDRICGRLRVFRTQLDAYRREALPRFSPSSSHDRILADYLALTGANPHLSVILVAGDLLLQERAASLRLPVIPVYPLGAEQQLPWADEG